MILWTMQPVEVYQKILKEGVYRCDIKLCDLPELRNHYDWLVGQMKQKIGANPYVDYPVWAWHTTYGKRKKPDLRRERYSCGYKGEKFVCLEIDIPDEEVVLSDFDAWSIILLNGFLSETEDEDILLEQYYESLEQKEKEEFRNKNWEKVFELNVVRNDWCRWGENIQATFWELRKEQIRKVHYFTCG